MLKIDFSAVGIERVVEIEKGVDWQFCLLSDCFKDCSQEAYMKDGVFVVTNRWLTFRAFDDEHTVYEVKLSAVEEGLLRFFSSRNTFEPQYGPLQEFENAHGEIELADFLKDKNNLEKIMIYEKLVKYPDSRPYPEKLFVEMDRSNDILRFYVDVIYQNQVEDDTSECHFLKSIKSRIKTMTLDDEVTFEFEEHSFMKIMKKIECYCERKNLSLAFSRKDFMLPGHCIDIPNTVVTSENFEIMFEYGKVGMVYVAKSIMEGSSYTDTLGDEYNIGTIVQEIRKETEGHTFVTDHGAEDICKMVYEEDSKYIFGYWF